MTFLSHWRELDPGAKRFLYFIGFNVLTWQCVCGPTILVLYAVEIGMPELWIGWLLSFMPFCILSVAFTVPLVERMGPKRLIMRGWIWRSTVALLLFLTPGMTTWWGVVAGWWTVSIAVFLFCLIRAIAVAGWYPWLHELVPKHQRGSYFGFEMIFMQSMTVALTLFLGGILALGDGVNRFYWIFGIGVLSGFASIAFLLTIPGGESYRPVTPLRPMASYRAVLADGRFIWFCLRSASGVICTWILYTAGTMYLRMGLGYDADLVMWITAFGALGVAVSIHGWGRYADRHGSGPSMFLALLGHGVVALLWLSLGAGGPWIAWAVWPLWALAQMFLTAFHVAKNRAMLTLVRADNRVGYTNVFMILDALAMGLTPVITGWIIQSWGQTGYTISFLLAGGLSLICSIPNAFVQEEGLAQAPYGALMARAVAPARTLARVFWVAIGLDGDRLREEDATRPADD